ncbi:YHS domain-containing protein [Clostridium thermopalmarium]|uniref:YHS domain protein n=1 Tax=Clostridium thermopalmarium DSM 5974 TaxID=1121340 RepID=A0A2T0AZJ0_9CLOT|nr:YHS domain-containing protein [Clostridium thermopalmarium]PRR76621.1 YHS domain protein [Clostridium thermopalmarium DSM 5974]PVZ28266.1 YHS domain-containing protein [Clostridium thermopalmarium DSM 5974]
MEFLTRNWLNVISAGLMLYGIVKTGKGSWNNNRENYDVNESSHRINSLNTMIDPICGMNVNSDTAIKQSFNGRTYYFCNDSCRNEFISITNINKR